MHFLVRFWKELKCRASPRRPPCRSEPGRRDWINATVHRGRHGQDGCVELLLEDEDERVDVSRGDNDGVTPLLYACTQLGLSMDRVGATDGKDPARCLVLMLKSRRIPIQNLTHSIVFLRECLPNRRDVTIAEASGTPLTQAQMTARLIVPVLEGTGRSACGSRRRRRRRGRKWGRVWWG